MRFNVVLAILYLATGLPTRAAASRPLAFEKDVRPVLKAHCFHCHGEGEKLKGGVDLRLRRFMLRETDEGPVMVPGKPHASLMVKLMRAGEMPKGEKKVPEKDIAIIERWIASGAQTLHKEPAELPKGFYISEEERSFWAFQPIRKVALPRLKQAHQVRNPIDAFVLAKLREQKLDFAPEADKSTLIRRVYLDLTGLPPTPEEVDAFLADMSADAYEKLVNRLLDSPQYAERWARHWLDVAGYADSNGFTESDTPRPHAWRYRDYVIGAFQADKPFNQFIVEQLAGDELLGLTRENATAAAATNTLAREMLAATGFLRMAPDGTADNPPDQNLARNQVMAETIKVVSSSLLGLTVGCAQCHDHRYDPISHADYHRLRAVFEPAYDWKNWRTPNQRLVSLYAEADRKKAADIETAAKKIDEESEKMRKEALEKVFQREIAKVPDAEREAAKAARNTARDKRTAEQKALLKKYPAADVQGALDLYDPEANKKVLAKKEEATKLRATKPAEPFLMALTEVAGKVPDTFLLYRGDHDQPKQKVEPGEMEILATSGNPLTNSLFSVSGSKVPSSGRRLAYARWLTSGQHPLTARVLVNQFWLHHFGRGLVNTPGDFGQLGERPTHPELLDWLASEFMANGWKLKTFHRLLMTSTVYRQSSQNESSLRADPENRFYARMKLRRLDAETLRDSTLAVSGKLNLNRFGPPVEVARDSAGRVVTGSQKTDGNGDPTGVGSLGELEFRRSVYVQMRRSRPLSVLDTFDLPTMSPNCEVRTVTTVAPQSLMMMNDIFVVSQSQHLAERLRKKFPGDLRAQINRGWRLLYGAKPTEAELRDSLTYLAEEAETIRASTAAAIESSKKTSPLDIQLQTLASLCQVLLGGNRFLYVD
ncbi:MAG: Planctomycete cytochrome [Verrucomicrobiales bacterium]|nr:Planctomycete cytochrome [Verrucomicrobiales bacterium]